MDDIYTKLITLMIVILQVVLIFAVIAGLNNINKSIKELSKSSTEYVIVEMPRMPDDNIDLQLYRDSIKIQKHVEPEEPISFKDEVISYVFEICELYDNVDPYIIQSVIFKESNFRPNVATSNKFVTAKDVGLMQVSTHWHEDRANKLGVTNFYDPYSNILIGTDYISELISNYDDVNLALMLYNMKHSSAFKLYDQGIISDYAKSVVAMADELRKE